MNKIGSQMAANQHEDEKLPATERGKETHSFTGLEGNHPTSTASYHHPTTCCICPAARMKNHLSFLLPLLGESDLRLVASLLGGVLPHMTQCLIRGKHTSQIFYFTGSGFAFRFSKSSSRILVTIFPEVLICSFHSARPFVSRDL